MNVEYVLLKWLMQYDIDCLSLLGLLISFNRYIVSTRYERWNIGKMCPAWRITFPMSIPFLLLRVYQAIVRIYIGKKKTKK